MKFKPKFLYLLKFILVLSYFNLSVASTTPASVNIMDSPKAVKLQYDNVPVVVLSGTPAEMGREYGAALKTQLNAILAILENYYMTQNGISYDALVAQADLLYNRFPADYQTFMQAEAVGSGLSLSDLKILNAMETLGELLPESKSASENSLVKCMFAFIPANETSAGSSLIGRNYDYPAPFDQLAQYVTVTVLKQTNKISTAFIAIAGEVYCPSCINAHGLFIELNNGMPSGGGAVNTNTESMLIRMLTALQDSSSLSQVANQLNNVQSDFSLIVNAGDAVDAESFEYSTSASLGMNYFVTPINDRFVSTNFFLDPVWGNRIPVPTDATTWEGVTRRNNMLDVSPALVDHSTQATQFDVSSFEDAMNLSMQNGGAVWALTIYQLIFDPSSLTLYVKIDTEPGSSWAEIPMRPLFN